ncbi:uncharacterized protein LOC124426120 [Vespa crabro]|uniref:uncharacterized protein LOC124426120 n=1 Tax=Vespa crabro TaxID=7445 RepID=UPI001F029AA1|nr:uncharacterized protein LOC124426120 [Vespa crabro]XP_046823372.1 uncharacterized protein LOC124426120 [Vespa crabro]
MHLRIVFVFVTFFWSVRSQLEENFPIIYSTINETKKISRNVESNYSTSIIDRSNVTENQTDFKVNVSNNEETSKYKTKDFEIIGKYVSKNDSDHSTNNIKTFVLESRDNQRNWGPHEEDILEAVDFGLQAMHDLYNVKEPKLYSMGLYLRADNPAKYVAAFNDQTEEARMLAKFGYAVLEGATMFVKKFPDMSREFPLSRNGPTTRLQRQCPRRGTPRCPPASLRYRTSDGSCNNLKNPWWGSAMSTMQRFLPPNYDDGIQTIRRSKDGNPLPSPRVISDVLHEDRDIQLASITHMLMQWGQFVDHDLTATGQSRGFNGSVPQCCLNSGLGFQPFEFMHPECLPIAVDPQDSFFARFGVKCLEFLRSGSAPREDCRFGAREQLSQVTSYLDASTVYSSNAFQSDNLRLFRNGLLQYGKIQSLRPLLPRQDSDLCKRGSLSTNCFRAGDGRLSEQPALTSIHVVFLRLHNRLATKLVALNPHWSDERTFQETRKIIGAFVQHITYREFLPIILGNEVMKVFDLEVLTKGYYHGYDPSVNPTIANSFSTAAYRFGHSLVQHSFVRFDGNHRPFFNNVSIHDEFRNSENLETAGSVDRLLLGLVNQPSQKRDEFITGELTRHLFQTPSFPFGMDLASLNIQRGRDHGIPPYVDWRRPCGLSPVKSFADLEKIMPSKSVIKFRTLYPYVEDIDLYSAGLAENSIRGGLVGPTFACIIAQQFSNLRHGDRFWYENEKEESGFTSRQLQQIRRITFSQVICHTIDNIKTIQPFVFLVADTFKNQRVDCNDELMTQFSLEPWIERPPEQRSGSGNIKLSDRKRTDQIRSTTSKSFTSLKQEATKENAKINMREQTKTLPQGTKPFKANINQHNRIVVKKPFGPPDNVTIVVQNNAVNSPVFVNDAIYGSYIQIQTTTQSHKDIPRPEYFNYQTNGQYNPLLYDQGSFNIPIHKPPSKPIPTVIPDRSGSLQNIRPYIPYSYDDPNNPNPLNYGYRPNYTPEDIVYDDFSPTSPRPTLYTYYMHAQQFKTTQRPIHHNEGQSSYYNPSYNKLSTVQHYQEVSPSPWIKIKPQFESNSQSYAQRLSSDGITNPHPQYNSNMNNRPEYWPHQTSSAIKDENIHSGQIYYNYNQDKSTDKPSNKDESSTWKYSTNVQKDNGFAISSSRPYNEPSVPQETDIHMNIPINRPYNEDDPDIYNKKPFDTSYLTMLNKSNDRNGLGNLPNMQVYQEEAIKNPILNNPSEWTNIPSYQQGPTKRPDSIILHEEPSYQKSPIKTPTIVQSDLSWTKVLSYQADLSKETSYQQGLTIKPDRSTSNSFYQTNPLKDSTNKSIEKTEDISYQRKPIPLVPIQELAKVSANNKSSRPTKIQSVTIVTESTETVQHSGSTGYRPENKINKEIPRPLELRQNDGKHGQYYYDKNVLHRYPEKIEDDISKDDHRLVKDDVIYNGTKEILAENKTIVELNYTDVFTKAHVIQNDNDKFITTPTIVINDSESYIDDDLDGAFSENIESVTTLKDLQRTNYWLNSEENPGLSSILEMPNVTSDESISVKELPKPLIKTSKSAS